MNKHEFISVIKCLTDRGWGWLFKDLNDLDAVLRISDLAREYYDKHKIKEAQE